MSSQLGRAAAAVAGATCVRVPISLEEVLRLAELQTRVDTKYLLTAEQFSTLDADLGDRFRVLEIDQRRVFGYDSVYFDSPDLATFRAHRQGRRRRFKARTRTYTDSAVSLFEVKLEGSRGMTFKERLPLDEDPGTHLDGPARDFLTSVLEEHDLVPPPQIAAVLRSTYARSTLVDPDRGTRLTFDVGLAFTGPGRTVHGPDRVVVESKSLAGGAADEALAERGIRPVGMSKYAVGVALTRPGVASNRWNRVLRNEFGWTRRGY